MLVIEILRIRMRGLGWMEGKRGEGEGKQVSVGERKLGHTGVGRLGNEASTNSMFIQCGGIASPFSRPWILLHPYKPKERLSSWPRKHSCWEKNQA
jgi:hypothetical protein